jgi:epoxyqueuosine reductase
MAIASDIREKALELGYEECGIINIAKINDYAMKLQERIKKVPETKNFLTGFNKFVNLNQTFPWAKSIVVCVRKYGKYYIPKHLQGLIAKYYLVDGRTDENSPDYKASIDFDGFLHDLKLQTTTERKFGVTALRWAALKAGLGTIRNNNFFYTEKSGSWVYLEAWLVDNEMELKHEYTPKKCPEHCNKCIKACPTKSLNEPFVMNQSSCVSYLTTFAASDMPNGPHNHEIGNWVFGCDACQDVCPCNKEKWIEQEEFPGLKELSQNISLEKIIEMDYKYLEDIIAKKFWYISKEKAYRWKINALNTMANNFNEAYLPYIHKACTDEHTIVCAMAQWVKNKMKILRGGTYEK